MLAQSTLLPLTSSSMRAWTPEHRHITLTGVVPPHTHVYNYPAGQSSKGPACVVTESPPGTVHNEPLVCAPGDDGVTATVVTAVQHQPSVSRVARAGVEAQTPPSIEAVWQSLVLPILTPPPRT